MTAISDPKGYIYQYTYDKDNRLTGTKNPLGETTATAYDPGSRITSVTDRMGLTESYTYDPHGNVLSVTATNGLITHFAYDILDNLVKVTMPSSLTATYTYDVMGNVTSATDTMLRTTRYTYDAENNMTSITDAMGRKEVMTYDIGGRNTSYTSNGGNKISYDYDRLNDLVEKSYEDARDPESKEGVLYAYDVTGQRVSMMDRSGESKYEYDGLGRITKVTSGSGEVTQYAYDGCDQLESITYADGKKVSYKYDKNDNLTEVTDRTGAVTTYTYDAINRVTEIHRPNGVSTYSTYNARDQITDMKNICDDCEWTISEYHYTYDDRGFIVGEDVTESLYAYAWDDKHDGKHENWHDDKFPHGDKHINKHAKDGIYNFQIIGTKRSFEYDDDGKLIRATEKEDRQGTYVYDYEYDDMGNRTFFKKSRNGVVQESAEYTYNAANQMVAARLYDGKHYKDVEYTYDADGNRVMQEEVKPDGNRKVELTYDYSVENRLKAVSDKNDLLVAMAYDGDGNRIFQLNYNLHTDDDWKGNSGNGNGNNKDNSGSGNKGNNSGNGTGSKKGILTSIGSFFGMDDGIEESEETIEEPTASNATARKSNGNKDKDKGNNGNDKNNGKGNGNGNSGNNGNGNSGNHGNGNGNTSTGGNNDNNGNANGNTNNTGGSQNQSGILFPIDGEVSELEAELIGMIKTTGKEKNYELVEYVNDVNREHVEVLMELNINGIMDTAYSYGNERLTSERFTEWTGYYTYDPRGSVTGVTDSKGMIWQSYRYNVSGDLTFGKPQYNNVYSYNAESYNPNMESQYLRARYYNVPNGNFLTEDSYLGNITDPLTLNRYNYVKSSPLNYTDPSGHYAFGDPDNQTSAYNKQDSTRNASSGSTPQYQTGSPNYSTSPYTKQSACKEISDEIKRHQGALLGAGVGVAIILITAATGGAPLLAVVGASAAYAGSGLIIGGALQKGIDSAYIAHKLKTEYGINVAEYQDIEVSQLPQEAQALCEQFEENGKDMETYLGEGTALSAAGAVIYEAGMLLDRIGPTVKEASKSAFERIKSWINGVTKGRSGTNTTSSNISPEMEEKILEGQRVGTSNKIIGGHSSNTVNNNSPNFAVEEVKINPDGTKVVKYYKQFPDGNVSRLKTSTLFPESWSDNEIIDAVQNIADSKPIGTRPLDGQTLHRGNINGVEIDVIKQGNDVISAYPVGGKPTPGFDPVN